MAIDRLTTQGIADGTIVNADISASAAITGTKITNITFPFYKANGVADNITISAAGEFPFYKADGTQDNIGVT
jgi:hypothetical protein